MPRLWAEKIRSPKLRTQYINFSIKDKFYSPTKLPIQFTFEKGQPLFNSKTASKLAGLKVSVIWMFQCMT